MKQISSIDLYYLIKEFKILENQRIDSFYYENETFFIKVYVKQKGNMYLTNKVSKYIYLDTQKDETSHPKNFIEYLRKYLKNTYIEEINQIENERIIKIKISKKEDEKQIYYYLFLELFANGNVILTDEDLIIKNSLEKRKFKDRNILVKEKYELPPQKELSIFNLNENLFKTKLKEDENLEIVKFLATRFGLGGKFSEEICEISQIDKNKKTNQINEKEITNLIKKLIDIPNKTLKPYGIYKNEELIDFIPYEFTSIKEEKKEFESFNQLIKTYYSKYLTETDQKEIEIKKELEKLQKRIQTLEQQKNEVEQDYEKLNSTGNKIYENYAILEELLNSINKSAKEKGWEHVEKTINENPKLKKLIKKLDYKNNEIILNLE